jgi:hypothetical protein
MDTETRDNCHLLPSSIASGCHHTPRRQVTCAMNACDEALVHIMGIRDELSSRGVPELRPEFWLYHLVILTGYLTMTVQDYLEDDHAAH